MDSVLDTKIRLADRYS